MGPVGVVGFAFGSRSEEGRSPMSGRGRAGSFSSGGGDAGTAGVRGDLGLKSGNGRLHFGQRRRLGRGLGSTARIRAGVAAVGGGTMISALVVRARVAALVIGAGIAALVVRARVAGRRPSTRHGVAWRAIVPTIRARVTMTGQ